MTFVQDKLSSSQRRIMAATSISYTVVLLDVSIVNVALEQMSIGLESDISGLQWVMNAYTLAFASLLLTGGTLGDRYGGRNTYLLGLVVFTIASASCGVAPNLMVLIIARVLQGIGASMLVPSSLKLISYAFPDADSRASAVGFWIGCGGVAMAAGPLVGGLLIGFSGWRSIFFVNVPVGLVGIWLTTRLASDDRTPVRHFDPAGQTAAIVALAALIAVLIEGSRIGWSSPLILFGILTSVIAGTTFFVIEAQSIDPMLPLFFFRNKIFAGSTFVSMASALVYYGLLFVLTLYYQQVLSYTPVSAGLAFLPMTILVAAGSIFSNRLIKLLGPRGSMCAAFGSYIVGSLGMLVTIPTSSYWPAVLPLFALGIASGFVSPAATAPAIGTVEQSRAGVAAAVLNSARQTGAALGVAIFGTFINSIQPFYSGMRATLWAAAAVSFMAILIWWAALVQERPDARLWLAVRALRKPKRLRSEAN